MTQKKFDIVAVGAVVVDMQLNAADADLAAHGLKKGLSNLVDAKTAFNIASGLKPARTPGGPGTNVAAGVALRGGNAALTGKIAGDDNGDFITQRLTAHGVHFHPLQPNDAETSTTAVLALTTPDKERTFAFAAGASMQMRASDIDTALISQAKITYIDSYLWLTEDGKAAVKQAAEVAKQSGGLVALALNDATLVAKNQPEFLALAKSHADILVGDKGEFMALFKTTTLEETLDAIKDANVIASMTMGKQGAYVVKDGAVAHVPARKIDQSLVIDTNGAGDQFAAGFLYGISKGIGLVESGQQGAAWASDVIQHFGAEPKVGRNAAPVNQNTPKAPKNAA